MGGAVPGVKVGAAGALRGPDTLPTTTEVLTVDEFGQIGHSAGGGGGGGTPDPHAASHGVAGSDPVTIAQSQVTGLGTAASADTTDFDPAGAASAVAATLTTHAGLTTAAHGGIVADTDPRLTNSRTPTAHAASHGSGGSDAITIAESQVTNLTTDLAAKALGATTITAGVGLTGGGDLTANRSFAVAYGATNTTACIGNDARLSDARTPTAHATSHKSGGTDAIKLNELAAPTAAVAFNAQKATGLAAPSATGDAARYDEISGGSTGQVFTSIGGGLGTYKTIIKTITCVIDGNGTVPAIGNAGFVGIPFAGTIVGTRIFSDVSGSAVVDVKKIAYGQTAPSSSIAASAKPTLSAALSNKDDTVTGWTTAVTKDDLIGFNLDSVTTCTKITVEILIALLP